MIIRYTKKLTNLFHIINIGYSGYKRKLVYLSIFGFLASSVESIGINTAIPLLYFAVGKPLDEPDKITEIIKSLLRFLNFDFTIKSLLIVITLMFIIKFVIVTLLQTYKKNVRFDYERNRRKRIFSSAMKATWAYLLKIKQGQIDTHILTNIKLSAAMLENLADVMVYAVSILVYFSIALYLSWYITFFAVVVGFIAFFIYKPIIFKIRQLARSVEAINRKIAHHVNEKITGMKSIKAIGAENNVIKEANSYFDSLKEKGIKIALYRIISNNLMQPLGVVTFMLIFAFFYKMPSYNFAYLAIILYLLQKMFMATLSLQNGITVIGERYVYLQKTIYFQNEIDQQVESDKGSKGFSYKREVNFNHIYFSYEGQKVFKDFNLVIRKGELLGIAGPSGGGKTTFVDLILRLLKPQAGSISIDGVNLNEIKLDDLRKNIGYVPQDFFILNDTIENNIKFYDDSISKENIIEAAKRADIYDYIVKCPQKFQTLTGERGVNMSSGQRQRLVIARILARRPKILIFDEATSALDNKAEKEIKNVINKLKGEITTIIIAHRLSNLLDSDKVVIIDQGRIIESGRPTELLNNKYSYFYKTHNINK